MQKQAKEAALKEQEDKPKANLEALKEQVGQWGWPRARVESRGRWHDVLTMQDHAG
jgi:hypothetical protein